MDLTQTATTNDDSSVRAESGSEDDTRLQNSVSRPPNRTASAAPKNALAALYGPIGSELQAVEQCLLEQLRAPHPDLAELLHHGTQLGGKRLRPAMLLLCGAATGELTDAHVTLGAVVEMVHTATLVHDDVLDEADSRRHVPTVNAMWNNHTSILLGDFLFAQSFRLAATLSSTSACQLVGEASRLVCEGELRQVLHRDVIELSEHAYIEMIRGKTAELCRVACQLGATFSDADDATITSLAEFGDAIGIAFQIADDYLDLWGDDETVGKTLGTDLEQGKMTLPLIRLRDEATPADRDRLVAALNGPPADRLAVVQPMLAASDAANYTRQTAESYRQRAINSLDVLPPSPAKESLRMMAEFSVNRRF